MKTEDIIITITKDDYGTDESYNLFVWCKRHKIKIDEPRDSRGLFGKMIIYLDTLEKQVLFQNKYIDKLKQYAEIINQTKVEGISCYNCRWFDINYFTCGECVGYNKWEPIK